MSSKVPAIDFDIENDMIKYAKQDYEDLKSNFQECHNCGKKTDITKGVCSHCGADIVLTSDGFAKDGFIVSDDEDDDDGDEFDSDDEDQVKKRIRQEQNEELQDLEEMRKIATETLPPRKRPKNLAEHVSGYSDDDYDYERQELDEDFEDDEDEEDYEEEDDYDSDE